MRTCGEGVPDVRKVIIDELRCKGCALCTIACPRDLIEMSDRINKQGYLPAVFPAEKGEQCTSCALCAQMCPDVAISIYRPPRKG